MKGYTNRGKGKMSRLLVLGVYVLLLGLAGGPALAAPELVIHQVYVSSVRDVAFTVSWNTDLPCQGVVRLGTSMPPVTVRTDALTTYNHLVSSGVVNPNTTYYFQVECGGVIDNNDGAYYSVTTGPIMGGNPPSAVTAGGTVYQSDGLTAAGYTLVYLRLVDRNGAGSLGNSAWAVWRATSGGIWGINLSTLRTEDLSGYFSYTPDVDEMQIVWQGGPYGTLGAANGTPEYRPAPGSTTTTFNATLTNAPTAVRLTRLEGRPHVGGLSWIGWLAGLAALAGAGLVAWRRRLPGS